MAIVHSSSSEKQEVNKKDIKMVDESALPLIVSICFGLSLLVIYFVNVPAYLKNTTLINALSVMGFQDENYYSCLKTKYEKRDSNTDPVRVCEKVAPTLDLFKKALNYNSFGNAEVRENMMNVSVSINRNDKVSESIKKDFAREVIGQLEVQVKETPLEARTHLLMGTYLAGIGILDQGILYLENALKIIPDKQYIMLQLGVALLEINQKDKAYELIRKSYELAPGYEDAAVIYIVTSFSLNKNEEAYKAVNDMGNLGIADERIVKILSDRKDTEKTIEYLKKVIEVNPHDEKAYFILSSFYLSLNNKVGAINTVDLMIKNNPDNEKFKADAEAYLNKIQNPSTQK